MPTPTRSLFSDPTFDRFDEVTSQTQGLLGFREAFMNSVWAVSISTILVLVLAIPAAYALAIRPVAKWRDVLFFFISTKFLPVVAAILPLWIIARELDLLNTRLVLIILYTAMNLPLAVWMLRSFFSEVPKELIEAAQIDGAKLPRSDHFGDPPHSRPWPGRHRFVVRDLRLERVLFGGSAQPSGRVDDSDLGHLQRQHPRQLPGQAVGCVHSGNPSSGTGRVAGSEADDTRPFDGSDQVILFKCRKELGHG